MTVCYRMRQILLQNATAILLQIVTEVCYKMCKVFYYKMRQLLQIATTLLQNATFITNCDSTNTFRGLPYNKSPANQADSSRAIPPLPT